MNKSRKYAFSLMEAMIILVLISVAIMALVPLISQQTTFLGWRVITDNGNIYLTYGAKANQHLGIATSDNTNLNNGKLVSTSAAIGFNNSAANKGISLGRDAVAANQYTQVRSLANTTGKIRIGQNACSNAANSVSVGSFDHTKAAANCSNTNIIQIGDANTTSINVTSVPRVTLKVGNQNVIDLNNNDFDFNLPDGTNLFDYEYATTKLNFSQNIAINGDLTFETWNPANATPDPADVQPYSCLTASDGQPFVRQDDSSSRCHWFCTASSRTGVGNPMCATPSDKRLKNVKSRYKKSIDDISKVDTFTYTYKIDQNKRVHVGLIAQKIIGVFDEALHKDNNGLYSYEREPILYAMVNSVKDILKKQNILLKQQYKSNKKADKLLKKYKK